MKSSDYPGRAKPGGMVGVRKPARVVGDGESPAQAPTPSPITPVQENTLIQPMEGEFILASEAALQDIGVDQIVRSPYQPRLTFNEQALEELANSIQAMGLAKPILVRPLPNGMYELVGGERRWRATKLLGLSKISAIVRPMTDTVAMVLALTDNEQEDLTDYERGRAYQNALESGDTSQRALARQLGINVSSVSRCVAMMSLPDSVKAILDDKPWLITLNYAPKFVAFGEQDPQKLSDVVKKMAEEGMQQEAALRYLAKPESPQSPRHRTQVQTIQGIGKLKVAGDKLELTIEKSINPEKLNSKLQEFLASLDATELQAGD
ncbi:ParB/RepB/Spo0J family partition protein [Pseudomonas sp. DP-17]|uniref:ParB/RepB/Spo0J family partition protein n=1 Tax=Pseudomonas sp. DP-17 TaxID=1580486 RepID=UPI001EFB8D7F|nr:ParB/RepB/Spo0J family partition protein [Pseudomonas sp. DP-17]MCG8911036.1 ParB/RepB/Spo0J family partition protein [Pseudomonas sp. DP-17]